MKINHHFTIQFSTDTADCNIDTITAAFKKALPLLLTEFVKMVLLVFAEEIMKQAEKPFCCDKCDNNRDFKWKTRKAKSTSITTIFAEITLPQMQVQCTQCGHKMFITRALLNIAPYKKMSSKTMNILALLGSLTSFRVSEKILSIFNIPLDKITVWRCVQKVGDKMQFNLDLNERARGEADGTGIPIQGIKKRGKELKVFAQETVTGSVRIAGLTLDRYDGGWDKLFNPLLQTLRMFPQFLLVTDGDTNILKGIKGLNIIFQRCLWHIPYQMRYYLWKDGVERKSPIWQYVISELLDITAIRSMIDNEQQVEAVIERKTERLEKVITYCEDSGFTHCAAHLRKARPDMFTAFRKRLNGKTTSKVERVMRTVNLRVNVGKWSMQGALNMLKVRLSYYYNGFDIDDDDNTNVSGSSAEFVGKYGFFTKRARRSQWVNAKGAFVENNPSGHS